MIVGHLQLFSLLYCFTLNICEFYNQHCEGATRRRCVSVQTVTEVDNRKIFAQLECAESNSRNVLNFSRKANERYDELEIALCYRIIKKSCVWDIHL